MPAVLHLASNPHRDEGVDFEELFDGLPDPAAYIGPDKRIAACNAAFRDRFPVIVESRFLEPLHSKLASNQAVDESCVLPLVEPKRQSITGGKTWPALQPRVTRLSSGGVLVVFKPISPAELDYVREIDGLRKELRCAEDQMHAALDSVATCKKNFANTGHELRTPLNAIVGFSDMMRQQTCGPTADTPYKRYADIIHDSALRLLDLINDILDFAKLDAGRLELRSEELEVLRVVVESVRELESLAAKSRIGLCVHVCDSVSLIVADHKRLRQMLTNLLSNALKFTPEGGEISIDVFRRREHVAISVSDTGIGMRAADIPSALELFGQVPRGTKHRPAGTGLGLPLTKQLAELHGGEMEIESVPGFGTTVTILLPAKGALPLSNIFQQEQPISGRYLSAAG